MKLSPKLTGKRIYIERHKPTFKNAAEFYAIVDANRDHILPWLAWASKEVTKRPEDSYNFMLSCFKSWEAGEKFDYVIRDLKTKKIAGAVSVARYDPKQKSAELGFWLSKEYTGQGLMQEAVKLLETELFKKGIARVYIRNEIENVKSANVARACGYYFEGVLRQSRYSETKQKFCDVNFFSKVRSDLK